MQHFKMNISSLLKEDLEKQIDATLDEQTIKIKGAGIGVFLVKKGSLNEKKYSDLILGEIELKGEIFYLCR